MSEFLERFCEIWADVLSKDPLAFASSIVQPKEEHHFFTNGKMLLRMSKGWVGMDGLEWDENYSIAPSDELPSTHRWHEIFGPRQRGDRWLHEVDVAPALSDSEYEALLEASRIQQAVRKQQLAEGIELEGRSDERSLRHLRESYLKHRAWFVDALERMRAESPSGDSQGRA
jgi:hypothetical protein